MSFRNLRLKLQPQRPLQYAGRVGSVVDSGADGAGDGAEQTRDVGDVVARRIEVGMVQRIEGVRAELQAYPFGERERLAQSQIQVEIPRTAQIVTGADLEAHGTGIVGVGLARVRVGEKGLAFATVQVYFQVRDRTGQNGWRVVGISGDKRVGLGKVGISAMHTGKAAHTPAADNFIEPATRSGAKVLSPPERQIVNEVSVEILRHIKVGVAAAFPRP